MESDTSIQESDRAGGAETAQPIAFTKIVLMAAGIIIGAVFIWSGLAKIIHPDEFLQNVRAYRVFSDSFNGPVAILLPWLELTAGVSCFLPRWRQAGAAIASALLAVFALLIPVALAHGPPPSCGCFGRLSQPLTYGTLFIDLVLLGAAIWVILFSKTTNALSTKRNHRESLTAR